MDLDGILIVKKTTNGKANTRDTMDPAKYVFNTGLS